MVLDMRCVLYIENSNPSTLEQSLRKEKPLYIDLIILLFSCESISLNLIVESAKLRKEKKYMEQI